MFSFPSHSGGVSLVRVHLSEPNMTDFSMINSVAYGIDMLLKFMFHCY